MSGTPSKCPFANLLGIPGEGVHATRIGGYAFVDTLLTVIAAYFTTYFIKISLLWSLIIWFILGEVFHVTYGVQTAFLTSIGIKLSC
jgi:hypothetical protein